MGPYSKQHNSSELLINKDCKRIYKGTDLWEWQKLTAQQRKSHRKQFPQESKLRDVGLPNEFLNIIAPKAQFTAGKNDKWNCIRLKISASKTKNIRLKRQSMNL